MPMKPANRKIALILALAGVGLLAWFAPEPATVPVATRDRASVPPGKSATGAAPTRDAKQAAAEVAVPATLPERDPLGKAKQDIFGFQTWQPPPPKPVPPPPPPPPPPPVPPPNPYRFAGRLMQDGQAQVFLTKGDLPVAIKVGDMLDGSYRIETITTTSISMTYVPLGYRETIPIPTGTDVSARAAPGLGSIPRPLVLSPQPGDAAPALNRAP